MGSADAVVCRADSRSFGKMQSLLRLPLLLIAHLLRRRDRVLVLCTQTAAPHASSIAVLALLRKKTTSLHRIHASDSIAHRTRCQDDCNAAACVCFSGSG